MTDELQQWIETIQHVNEMIHKFFTSWVKCTKSVISVYQRRLDGVERVLCRIRAEFQFRHNIFELDKTRVHGAGLGDSCRSAARDIHCGRGHS